MYYWFSNNSSHKKVPMWKALLVIALVIALPLFFSNYRIVRIEQVINNGQAYVNDMQIPEIQLDKPELNYKQNQINHTP